MLINEMPDQMGDLATMTDTKVSVVIPSYASPHLGAVIEALAPIDPFEIIVVESSRMVPELPDHVKVVQHDTQVNAATARNMGAKKARGEYLLFVDADVVLVGDVPHILGDIIRDMAQVDGPDVVCGLYQSRDGETRAEQLQNAILAYRLHDADAGEGTLWSSSHFVVRRDIFRNTGGFDETLDIYEDMEFFLRCGFFDLSVTVNDAFRAHHLKSFSGGRLIQDYFKKARAAITTRLTYPRLFKGHSGGIPSQLHMAGMAGAIALIALVLSVLVPSGFGASIATALLAGLLSVALFPSELLKNTKGVSRPYAATVWAGSYIAILSAMVVAATAFYFGRAKVIIIGLSDFARQGMRVLFRTGRPIQIINYVTSRCNLRCNHCFYKESLDDPNPGEIPEDRLIQTMREIGPVLWYSLAGGEPFIRKDLESLILNVQDICRPRVFSFPTNGWYTERTFEVAQRVLQRLDRGNLILFFSVDGPQDIHDEIRGKDSFKHLRETIDRLQPLKRVHPNLYINLVTTITPTNADVASIFVRDLVREFKPDALSINLYREHSLDGPRLPDQLIESYNDAVDAYADEVAKGQVGGYGFFGSRILRAKEFLQKDLIYRVAKTNEFVTPCTAGTLSYVIMEDGSVKPCEILSDSIGNIYDSKTSFEDILNGDSAKKTRKWIKDTDCRCTYECAMSTNTLFSWPMVPKLIRKTFFG